jgi:hypothetical protein
MHKEAARENSTHLWTSASLLTQSLVGNMFKMVSSQASLRDAPRESTAAIL